MQEGSETLKPIILDLYLKPLRVFFECFIDKKLGPNIEFPIVEWFLDKNWNMEPLIKITKAVLDHWDKLSL